MSTIGYNDKLHVLLQHVLDRVKNFQVSPERLDVIRAHIKLEWENFFLGQSYRISDYYGHYLMNERQWTIKEKLEVLPCKRNPARLFYKDAYHD